MPSLSIKPVASLGTGYDPRFSPCGRYLTTMPSTAPAKLFRVDDWNLAHRLEGLKHARQIVINGDATTVIAASHGEQLAVFSTTTGEVVDRRRVKGSVETNGLEVAADGDMLFHSAMSKHVSVLSRSDASFYSRLENPSEDDFVGDCKGITLSEDGRWLAAAFRNGSQLTGGYQLELAVWSLPELKIARTIALPDTMPLSEQVDCLCNVPNSSSVAVVSGGDRMDIVDMGTGDLVKQIHNLSQGSRGGLAVGFSRCGQFVAVGSHNRISVYDPSLSQVLGTVEIDSAGIYGAAFSPDGKFLAASNGSTYVWETSQIVE